MNIRSWPPQKKAENQLEHWLQKVCTTQQSEEARKAPVATNTGEVEDVSPKNESKDRLVWVSEVKAMIGPALEEFEMKSDSRASEMAEKTVIDALKMWAVGRQEGDVRSVAFLTIK